MIQIDLFQLGPSNLMHILFMTRGYLLIFKVMGQGHTKHCYYTLLTRFNPFYIANYIVISALNSPVGRILQRWCCSCSVLNQYESVVRLFNFLIIHVKSIVVDIFYHLLRIFQYFVFTENTEFGVCTIYNTYTPALVDEIRYTYTYDIILN